MSGDDLPQGARIDPSGVPAPPPDTSSPRQPPPPPPGRALDAVTRACGAATALVVALTAIGFAAVIETWSLLHVMAVLLAVAGELQLGLALWLGMLARTSERLAGGDEHAATAALENAAVLVAAFSSADLVGRLMLSALLCLAGATVLAVIDWVYARGAIS